jgi:hypothetical protein
MKWSLRLCVTKEISLDKRIFNQMWADIGADNRHLVYHSDVSWQSRGNAFQRAVKLVNDVKIYVFEAVEPQVDIKGPYLSDTIAEVNKFNNSMHDSYQRVNIETYSFQRTDETVVQKNGIQKDCLSPPNIKCLFPIRKF